MLTDCNNNIRYAVYAIDATDQRRFGRRKKVYTTDSVCVNFTPKEMSAKPFFFAAPCSVTLDNT